MSSTENDVVTSLELSKIGDEDSNLFFSNLILNVGTDVNDDETKTDSVTTTINENVETITPPIRERHISAGSKNVVSTGSDNLVSQTGPTTTTTPNENSVSGATTARYKKNDDFMDDDVHFPITKNYQFCLKPCRRLCCHPLVDTDDHILRQERRQLLLQMQLMEEEETHMVKHMEARMDCLMGMCCKKP